MRTNIDVCRTESLKGITVFRGQVGRSVMFVDVYCLVMVGDGCVDDGWSVGDGFKNIIVIAFDSNINVTFVNIEKKIHLVKI